MPLPRPFTLAALRSALLRWVVAVFCVAHMAPATAQEPSFPWCPTAHRAAASPGMQPNPVYQTLAKSHQAAGQLEPVAQLPAKKSYAYGWFGSNPTPTWGRHFGYSRNFTQWTQR